MSGEQTAAYMVERNPEFAHVVNN